MNDTAMTIRTRMSRASGTPPLHPRFSNASLPTRPLRRTGQDHVFSRFRVPSAALEGWRSMHAQQLSVQATTDPTFASSHCRHSSADLDSGLSRVPRARCSSMQRPSRCLCMCTCFARPTPDQHACIFPSSNSHPVASSVRRPAARWCPWEFQRPRFPTPLPGRCPVFSLFSSNLLYLIFNFPLPTHLTDLTLNFSTNGRNPFRSFLFFLHDVVLPTGNASPLYKALPSIKP